MPWLCCHVNPKTKREDCYKVADQHDELPPADDGQKQNMFSWERRAQMDIEKFRIHDVDGDTVVRRGVAGQPMIIETCKDTNIIVLDHTSTITVDDCTGCLIVLGPCAGSVFLRECRSCTVLVACQQLRTRDCRSLRIALHCSTQPIIEETSDAIFHPLALHYDSFIDDMIAAHLSIFTSYSTSVHDFTPEEGSVHYRMSSEVLSLGLNHVSVLSTNGVSTNVHDSDIPFKEPKISQSYYYYAGYSRDVPQRQFIERCQEVAHAIFASPSVRLVSTIELDVHKQGTKIAMSFQGLSTLVVFEVCGEAEDVDHLMNASDAGFTKIPEHEQESSTSAIAHVIQLMPT